MGAPPDTVAYVTALAACGIADDAGIAARCGLYDPDLIGAGGALALNIIAPSKLAGCRADCSLPNAAGLIMIELAVPKD